MSNITFFPGPSRVHSNIPDIINEAYAKGYLSMSHRSESFIQMMKETKEILKQNLSIPQNYEIAFTSSATESWEIIAQSVIKNKSQHFFNGSFGEKWHQYTQQLNIATNPVSFDINQELPLEKFDKDADVICYTQNETSNGTEINTDIQKKLQNLISSNQIITVDATSSMGGIHLDFSLADIWFGSVQKCFGLPAGLGIIIISPKAMERMNEINENNHYNSLINIIEFSKKNQTHYTPNVLAIYLLLQTQKNYSKIESVDKMIRVRHNTWENAIDKFTKLSWLITNKNVRSKTVLAIKYDNPDTLKKQAKESNIILGNGYGSWKSSTFRIANFPAITDDEINKLIKFFDHNIK